MPKLGAELASGVKTAAENSGFTPMDEADYYARLVEVEAKPASTGSPMWVWKYEVLGPVSPKAGEAEDRYRGRNQWVNTVLTDKALWKVAEQFSAFGVPTDTDTDELIGCTCIIKVIQRKITGGAREGQIGNDVQRTLPDERPSAVRHPNSEIEGGSAPGAPAPVSPEEVGSRF